MAEKKATLWITLKDEVTSGLTKIQGGVASLRSSWLAVTAAVAGTLAVTADLLREYANQEAAVSRLNTALRNQGTFTREYSEHLVKLSSELQKVTTFSDETILETEALLTTFGLAGKELEAATKAALDLSVGLGVDLRTATLLLGKAWSGETSTLARYGIQINDALQGSEKFAAVLDQVSQRFGGAATAAAETFSGSVARLANQWGEFREQLGQMLAGPASQVITWASEMVGHLQSIASAMQSTSGSSGVTAAEIARLGREADDVRSRLSGLAAVGLENSEQYRLLKSELQEINLQVQDLSSNTVKLNEASVASLPASREVVIANADIFNTIAAGFNQEAVAFERAADQTMKLAQLSNQANAIVDQSIIGMTRHVTQAIGETLVGANTNWRKVIKGLVLMVIDAAMQITTVWIALSTMMTASLFSGPAPALATLAVLGVLRGVVGAAFSEGAAELKTGSTQTVQVASQNTSAPVHSELPRAATGMVVMPRFGGVPIVTAEAGVPEAVIPLGDSRSAQMIRDALAPGGGGTTININAGTIVADRVSAIEFAKMMDEELFRLRRNGQSVAFD